MKRRSFLTVFTHAALVVCAPLSWAACRVLPERVVVALRARRYPGRVKSWRDKQPPGPGPWAG